MTGKIGLNPLWHELRSPLWHDPRSYIKALGGGDTFIFFKILKEPMLVQNQTVPHMKAPILNLQRMRACHHHGGRNDHFS